MVLIRMPDKFSDEFWNYFSIYFSDVFSENFFEIFLDIFYNFSDGDCENENRFLKWFFFACKSWHHENKNKPSKIISTH